VITSACLPARLPACLPACQISFGIALQRACQHDHSHGGLPSDRHATAAAAALAAGFAAHARLAAVAERRWAGFPQWQILPVALQNLLDLPLASLVLWLSGKGARKVFKQCERGAEKEQAAAAAAEGEGGGGRQLAAGSVGSALPPGLAQRLLAAIRYCGRNSWHMYLGQCALRAAVAGQCPQCAVCVMLCACAWCCACGDCALRLSVKLSVAGLSPPLACAGIWHAPLLLAHARRALRARARRPPHIPQRHVP
jgi:hypothetical protein